MNRNQRVLLGIVAIILLLAGALFLAPRAEAEFPPEKVTIVNPEDGASLGVSIQPDFWLEWTWYPDTLFYLVRITMSGLDGEVLVVEHRYVPDQSHDWRRDNAIMNVPAGDMIRNVPHTITVTPYGMTEELIETYQPNRYNPPPTHLPIEWYDALAPASDPVVVTFTP